MSEVRETTASSLAGKTEARERRTTVVKERMDLLELLRKRGVEGDVDFLREALRVLPWRLRCHRGSVLGMENAALSG